MTDPIAEAAIRLLALMGTGGELWEDGPDTVPPLTIGEFDRQAIADAQLEQHRSTILWRVWGRLAG